jgi:geranylgeranylglycerol-phosphate geranylgeranyltransferase
MRTLWKYISGFLIVARVITSSLLTLAVFLPSLQSGNSFRLSVLLASPFLLTAIGGFALNDFYDVQKDRINKPYRAIPSGKLPATVVLWIGVVCLAASPMLAVIAARNSRQLFLYAVTICGAAAYNLFIKYLSQSKTFLTAALSAIPLVYSIVSFNYTRTYLLLPLATACYVLGREWLMDIRDMRGDHSDGTRTIPMLVGPSTTQALAFILHFLSIALLIPLALNSSSNLNLILVVLMFLFMLVMARLWYRSVAFQRRVVQGFWIPMLLGELLLLR